MLIPVSINVGDGYLKGMIATKNETVRKR